MSSTSSGGRAPAGPQSSYVNTNLGLVGTLKEFRNLFLFLGRHDIATWVRRDLEDARAHEVEISALLGAPVAGLKVLEIGPGQKLMQLAYFGEKNEVVGSAIWWHREERALAYKPAQLPPELRSPNATHSRGHSVSPGDRQGVIGASPMR